MKKSKKNLCIDLEIYKYKIIFSFAESDIELCNSLKKLNISNADLEKIINAGYGCVDISGNYIIIKCKNKPTGKMWHDNISKKIFLCCCMIFEKEKIYANAGNERFIYSSLIGYITNKVYDFIDL